MSTPAVPVVTTEPKVKFVREYQPKDKNGLAIGPLQRFEADTMDELADKLAAAHQNASVKVYQTIKAAKFGELVTKDDDEEEPIYEFQPRPLSADERVRISNELKDPEKQSDAVRTLIEAEFGAPLEAVRAQFRENALAKLTDRARASVEIFIKEHPEYVPSENNQNLLIGFIQKKNLRFNKKNLEFAYEELRGADLLTTQAPRQETKPAEVIPPAPAAPVVVVAAEPATPPAPAIPAPATPATPISPAEPLRPAQSSSGLSRDSAAAVPPSPGPPKTQGITFRDINALTADGYAEALQDGWYEYTVRKDSNTGRTYKERGKLILSAADFRKAVDDLYATQKK